MQDSALTQLALPLIIALIMFGMGLSLTVGDFSRILRMPKAVAVGLVGQMLLMPALAFALALLFNLSPPLAIGLMILAACPGGTMSNVISHAAGANLALSVTLTSIATLMCVVTTPLLIGWSQAYFSTIDPAQFSILQTTLGLLLMTLVPVAIGMLVRRSYPSTALYLAPYFRRFSGVFIALMIVAILIEHKHTLSASFSAMFLATLSLNLAAISVGLLLAFIARLSAIDGVTLGIEVGIQNAALAIVIAVSLLKQPDYAIAAGVYGVSMYIGTILLAILAKKTHQR